MSSPFQTIDDPRGAGAGAPWWRRGGARQFNLTALLAATLCLHGQRADAQLLSLGQPQVLLQADSDGDGIGDLDELTIGTDPSDAQDGWSDDDFDGLSLAWELYLWTDPAKFDTDNDGYGDGAEVFIYQTDPLDAQSRPRPGGGGVEGSVGMLGLPANAVDYDAMPPSLDNPDFSVIDFDWWRDGSMMTDYMGGGFKWNYGTLPAWTAYVGTKVEVWSTGGNNFIELDATVGHYGIKQPISDVRAGHYVLAWRQLGRKSAKAEKNSFKILVYHLENGVEKLLASPFVMATVATDQWRDASFSFHLSAAQLSAASSGIFIAMVPTGKLNSYGTLIDEVHLGAVEVKDGAELLASLPLGEDPWTNANIQRTVAAESIAWITGNSTADGGPEMPQLTVRITGAPATLSVQWRFECEYRRGNGYRKAYISDFTRPEDRVGIPQKDRLAFTEPMSGPTVWSIHESAMWLDELRDRGFFGGLAKVFLRVGSAPEAEVCRFRIGGKNPDELVAKTYIVNVSGPTFWYAFAIAKHETYGRVPGRFYSQFYTNHQAAGGRIGDNANDMGWAAWANGWPLYNLDRRVSEATGRYVQNGPGGYGVFQLTLGPKLPNSSQADEAFVNRREIWNWQDNCRGAIEELKGKLNRAKNLESALNKAYPEWPKIAEATYGGFDGLEAIVITYYNGMSRGEIKRVDIGRQRERSCWFPETMESKTGIRKVWRFLQNQENYVQSINFHLK